MKSTYLVIAAALFAAGPALCRGDEPGPKPDELFGQLDKNKDGSVAGDEVGEAQKALFERLVKRGDKNSDGKLTKEEFVQGFKDEKPAGPDGDKKGPRLGRVAGALFDPEKAFSNLDKNGDGKLTIEEIPNQARERLGALFERVGKTEVTKEQFQQFSAERRRRFENSGKGTGPANGEESAEADDPPPKGAGKGGDGPPEGAGEGGPRRGRFGRRGQGPPGEGGDAGPEGMRRGPMNRVPKFVELLDTDKDQSISKDEFSKAAELFDKLDANKDGKLDMAEVLGPQRMGRPGGPDGAPGDGPRRGRMRNRGPGGPGGPPDGGPGEAGSPKGGPADKGKPDDNPPPKNDESKDGPDA